MGESLRPTLKLVSANKRLNHWSNLDSRDGIEYNELNLTMYGTDIVRVFLKVLTKEIPNPSVVYRGSYNIHYHTLYPELEDFSLVKGIIK